MIRLWNRYGARILQFFSTRPLFVNVYMSLVWLNAISSMLFLTRFSIMYVNARNGLKRNKKDAFTLRVK